jgi:4'-phosphopantetheinyl transferase EntD
MLAPVTSVTPKMLSALFPRGVIAVSAEDGAGSEAFALHPEEAAAVEGAVARRRAQFACGRACARRALAMLGIENFPLVPGPRRAPLWPPGVVGSITHCDGFCAAAVARAGVIDGLGLDAEPAVPLAPSLLSRVCLPSEREWLARSPPPPLADWSKLVFSAKECAYKCWSPWLETVLEFHDVEIQVQPETNAFRAHLRRAMPVACPERLDGRYLVTESHIVTGVTSG